ncbi:conserved Plasmodium protein, unknown function [Plasmodium sp. DRC-Itaito]|nr:conserved Plasmodium protein, unknown function [Plasmodium sp. DRC-Itaito]
MHISSLRFYLFLNNVPRFNTKFLKIVNSFYEFSTKKYNNDENSRNIESDKKIQLTNFKLSDSSLDYISSDDSDEEYVLERGKLKAKENIDSCGNNNVLHMNRNYIDREDLKNENLEHFDIKTNCVKKNICYSNDTKCNMINDGNIKPFDKMNETSNNNEYLKREVNINNKSLIDNNLCKENRMDKIYNKSDNIIYENINSDHSNNIYYEKNIYDTYHSDTNNKCNNNNNNNNNEDIQNYLKSMIKENQKNYCCNTNNIKSLNDELSKLEYSLKPSINDINNMKIFLNFLQNEINKHYKNSYVTPFGSVINGFWMRNSDIDICIQIPILLNRKDQITFLKKICLLLNNFNNGIIEQRFSAKVPIIHFYCNNREKSFELSCDISVNNILAVINSKLIQKYVAIDKRLQTMGIVLKYWSKIRNINDRSKGFLSSFSLILMIIHFLQNVAEPKILPSLQDISIKRNEKPFYIMGVDCKYCQDDLVIRDELKRLNNNIHNNLYVDISTLLIEFFKFYGYKYKSGIIAIRDINDYYQNFQTLKKFESYFLFVDNPFEVGKNVANIFPSNYKTIINEMQRAYKILKNNGSWKDVCNSKENFLYS